MAISGLDESIGDGKGEKDDGGKEWLEGRMADTDDGGGKKGKEGTIEEKMAEGMAVIMVLKWWWTDGGSESHYLDEEAPRVFLREYFWLIHKHSTSSFLS